jgi:acetyl-CoA C-acetyltransferase
VIDVASGAHDIVLSGGVEITNSRPMEGKPAHMREPISQGELWYRTNYGADQAYWYPGGLAVPSLCDFACMTYAKKYGLTLEQMGDTLNAASINNRRNAVRNPLATTYHKELADEARDNGFSDVKEYMKSNFNPKIGTIMRALNGATVVDGASALIVCPTEMARSFTDHPIDVIGFGSAVTIPYHEAEAVWESEKEAFAQAYKMAKINPYRDIDYMHVHDCLISTHFAVTETGGYFRPGEAWRAIIEGRTAFDGDKPISTTGGRSSMGHAWSASAGAEITEAVRQMRGLCGARQIKPTPEVRVIHNLGHGIHVNVSVLRTHS